MTVATRLMGRKRASHAAHHAAPVGAMLDVRIEYFGRPSGRRRRELATELRGLLEWELPQHLRDGDLAVSDTRHRVRVLLPGTPLATAERVADRLRRTLVLGPLAAHVTLCISATVYDA